MSEIQDSLSTVLALKKETDWGEAIPAAGAGGTAARIQVVRGAFSLSKELDETEEIREDRADTGEGELTRLVQGQVHSLLRPFGVTDALAYLFEGAYGSTWSTAASSTITATTTSVITVASGTNFRPGMVVKVASGANAGCHLVTAVSGNDLTVAAAITAGQSSGNIASANLTTGTTRVSFLGENEYPSVESDSRFVACNGLRVGSVQVNVEQGRQVQAQFELSGKTMAVAADSVFGTRSAAPTSRHYEASSHVPGVYWNGTALSATNGGIVKSVQLGLQNALRPEYGVGSPLAQFITPGVFRVNGSLEAYFQDKALLDSLLSGTPGTLSVFLRATGGGDGISFTFPRVSLSTGGPSPATARESVMQRVNFKATLGVTDAVCARISIGV